MVALRQFGALALIGWMAALWGGLDYALGQLTFVATWAIAGLGLVLIVGHSGQISLGHGATLAVGAYVQAGCVALGVPALAALALAMAGGAALGWLASLPARRLGGLAFGMSTLALALIVEELLLRLEPLTGGPAGLAVPAFSVLGLALASPAAQAALSALLLGAAWWLCARLLASSLGRSWRATREDEIAAQAAGIDVAQARTRAFVAGGTLGALAGALYAHWLGYLSPEQFGLPLSFELLMLVFIGGARRLAGALWGAVVLVALPQAIALLSEYLPARMAASAGLEMLLFGALLVALVLIRPGGLLVGGR